MALYRQMAGRVIRPAPGKTDALILDHAGAVFMHGFIEDPIRWTLSNDKKADVPAHVARGEAAEHKLLSCPRCSAVRTAGKPCPECGFLPKRPPEYLDVRKGELVHLKRNGALRPQDYTPEQKREFHAGLVHICIERGNKLGAAAHRFRERFGHWPVDRHIEPKPPTSEVIAWDRHCRIRYVKAIQKVRGANG
jgi:hypothetical protein